MGMTRHDPALLIRAMSRKDSGREWCYLDPGQCDGNWGYCTPVVDYDAQRLAIGNLSFPRGGTRTIHCKTWAKLWVWHGAANNRSLAELLLPSQNREQ